MLGSVLRGRPGDAVTAALVYLPVALVGTALVIPLTDRFIAVTDELSAWVVEGGTPGDPTDGLQGDVAAFVETIGGRCSGRRRRPPSRGMRTRWSRGVRWRRSRRSWRR